ncbi:MAG: S8 family serine peptidase [Campylobacterales bacterium]|nr:S8 family serine peptidase [Campylobacterales bacterium]
MDGLYVYKSGTSMATPHVTASAALLLSLYPTLTPDEVKTTLKNTAENLGLTPAEEGAGLVRPDQAIQTPSSSTLPEGMISAVPLL